MKRRFASQPRGGGGLGLAGATRPAVKTKRRKQTGGAHAVLPHLPTVKVTSGKTAWSNTAGARILADFTIPQAAMRKVAQRKGGGHRANSAVSNRSKMSGRSMDSATERSFKPVRNKGGASSMSSARKRGQKTNRSSDRRLQGQYPGQGRGPEAMPMGPGQSKYIKNVMNIPAYLQDRGNAQPHPEGNQFVIQNSVVSVNMT